MNKTLKVEDILYSLDLSDIDKYSSAREPYEDYQEILEEIHKTLSINEEGFNLYIIDDYSREKLDKIISFINSFYKRKERPKDICLVIKENVKVPEVLYLQSGMGHRLQKLVHEIQSLYEEKIFKFYNSSLSREKEDIMDSVQKERNNYISILSEVARGQGFEVKHSILGFSFTPLKEGTVMTEREYEELEAEHKNDIIGRASALKVQAEVVIDKLKALEEEALERARQVFKNYLDKEFSDYKADFEKVFLNDAEAVNYLMYLCDYIESNVIENYSFIYEDDELKISEAIYRFAVNVLVDNKSKAHSEAIFLQDPTISNLLGNIEYENQNGVYRTDVTLIKAGALLEANEGALIIRLADLLSNAGAYYYLKKALMSSKVNFDYHKGYLEFLAVGGVRPKDISINTKVIIIGDEESYSILYNYDEDFKKIFKLKAPYMQQKNINSNVLSSLFASIEEIIVRNGLLPLSKEGLKEIIKHMSRAAGSRNKLCYDISTMSKILILSNYNALNKGKKEITKEDLLETLWQSSVYEKHVQELYENKKIIFSCEGKRVGVINALAVIESGDFCFGRPLRITALCVKGDGNIIDAQKESSLSGNIHDKSISILKAFINKLVKGYERISVDFYISFEQIYGRIDGDSASVAEAVSMISSITGIPIRQNIAITGSMNQLGEVQAIGGVNEKIEGFFDTCQLFGEVKHKAVLIPEANAEELVLRDSVEAAVIKGDFNIITMETIDDAIEVLMCTEEYKLHNIYELVAEELTKYSKRVKEAE